MTHPEPSDRCTVVVWNENVHERSEGIPRDLYPNGIHTAIATALRAGLDDRFEVRTATLDQRDHGLPAALLDDTDVLLWWGHLAHDAVPDELAVAVQQRVLDGMGLIALHSAHYSKPFRRLMGTSCGLLWREADDRELVWTVNPSHPIAAGVAPVIALERHEMYGEVFDVPAPDELVFISSFSGGEVFRSGCCFFRGRGRIFYFSPGHETYPIYHDPSVQRVLANAVRWARATARPLAEHTLRNAEAGWFAR